MPEGLEARFEALYREHYWQVLRYTRRRVGDDLARDITAETFLVAWRRLGAVPNDALPWLYGVARNLLRNEARSAERARRLVAKVEATEQIASPDLASEVAEGRDEAGRIQAALSRMRPADQEVLRLVGWEGLESKQAAATLGVSSVAFAVRLHRARRRLEQALAADSNEPAQPAPLRTTPSRTAGRRVGRGSGSPPPSRATSRCEPAVAVVRRGPVPRMPPGGIAVAVGRRETVGWRWPPHPVPIGGPSVIARGAA